MTRKEGCGGGRGSTGWVQGQIGARWPRGGRMWHSLAGLKWLEVSEEGGGWRHVQLEASLDGTLGTRGSLEPPPVPQQPPQHITVPFKATQHLFPPIKTNNLLCQKSRQPLSAEPKGRGGGLWGWGGWTVIAENKPPYLPTTTTTTTYPQPPHSLFFWICVYLFGGFFLSLCCWLPVQLASHSAISQDSRTFYNCKVFFFSKGEGG